MNYQGGPGNHIIEIEKNRMKVYAARRIDM